MKNGIGVVVALALLMSAAEANAQTTRADSLVAFLERFVIGYLADGPERPTVLLGELGPHLRTLTLPRGASAIGTLAFSDRSFSILQAGPGQTLNRELALKLVAEGWKPLRPDRGFADGLYGEQALLCRGNSVVVLGWDDGRPRDGELMLFYAKEGMYSPCGPAEPDTARERYRAESTDHSVVTTRRRVLGRWRWRDWH